MVSGNERSPLDLQSALRILRSRWLWVLLPLVAATALQLGLALRATPMYSSSVDMLLRGKATDGIVSGVEDPNAIGSNDFYSDRVIATEIRVINSDAVFTAAAKKLGFEARVTATGDPDAAILRITAVTRVRPPTSPISTPRCTEIFVGHKPWKTLRMRQLNCANR
jgi:uncharacterized protein involved in exopolysaccharide biosynthesis